MVEAPVRIPEMFKKLEKNFAADKFFAALKEIYENSKNIYL